jgi:tRNA(Ile)-lysidine synthase
MFDTNMIKTTKNLLAFSGGVDSTALFFLLIEKNIPFDIVIVDYRIRKQSKQEIKYAKELAKRYNKICYTTTYTLDKFSEKTAREFRYSFFDNLMQQHSYQALLTAHQLNDTLEWFLMQLSKGAGLFELIGLKKIDKRKDYILYKPLLDISKKELKQYLKNNNIKYFIDKTNKDTKYKRNYFRKYFSNKLIKKYKHGIQKSFQYLQNDIDSLHNLGEYFGYDDVYIAKFKINDINIMMRFIDKSVKKLGVVLSKNTKDEIVKQKEIIISGKISVAIVDNVIWVTPYKKITMDKKFKDKCRVLKIPKNSRGYLYASKKLNISIFKYNLDKMATNSTKG